MDLQEAGTAQRTQRAARGRSGRVFLRAPDSPLPDGVAEGDAGMRGVRMVGPARTEMEAANVAY